MTVDYQNTLQLKQVKEAGSLVFEVYASPFMKF